MARNSHDLPRFPIIISFMLLAALAFSTSAATAATLSDPLCVGTGNDGPLTVSVNTTWDEPRAVVETIASATALVLGAVVDGTGTFAPGDEVMVVQMLNSEPSRVGTYEFAYVQSYSHPNLDLADALARAYDTAGNALVQVVRVPNYTSVTIDVGVTLTAPTWNNTGGVIVFRATGAVTVDGTITASECGYRGAGGGQGEGYPGTGTASPLPNGNGGGQGQADGYCSGGGGGHADPGDSGTTDGGGTPGEGGLAVGIADLYQLTMGGGGGTGLGPEFNCCCSGKGGGIIAISAGSVTVTGRIQANGENGGGPGACGGPGPDWESGGVGGGAGGSIALQADTTLDLGTGLVTALGGSGTNGSNGGPKGGNGSSGRIAVRGSVTGTTSPSYDDLFSICHGVLKPGPTSVSRWRLFGQ